MNAQPQVAAATVLQVHRELEMIGQMTMGELVELYERTYGRPTLSRNKGHLRRKLQFRAQVLVGGGLSDAAREKIKKLGCELPEAWLVRLAAPAATDGRAPGVEA